MLSYNHYSKRQKLSEKNNFTSLSNVNSVKHDFLLEINGKSECNANKDSNIPSWIKYDVTKTNKQLDLSGGDWSVGINSCIISNSLTSWKNATNNITNLPSLSFIKIGLKIIDKPTEIIGMKSLKIVCIQNSKLYLK